VDAIQRLSEEGAESFYTGQMGKQLVTDLGGSISEKDLANYKVVEREPVAATIGDYRVNKSCKYFVYDMRFL